MTRLVETFCTVEVAHGPEALLAHVELAGVEVGAGDRVVVHDAPTAVPFGDHVRCRRRATVQRAGPLGRLAARLAGYRLLGELYEIGFSAGGRKP